MVQTARTFRQVSFIRVCTTGLFQIISKRDCAFYLSKQINKNILLQTVQRQHQDVINKRISAAAALDSDLPPR